MRQIIAMIAALCLSACAGSFARPDPAAPVAPPPANFEEAIRAHMMQTLFDPFTAQYQFGRPYRAYANNGLVYGGEVIWNGWAVDFQVNAKNRFGGYVGYTPYVAVFDGDTVRRVLDVRAGDYAMLFHRLP